MDQIENLEFFIECKDHTVTGEKFQLRYKKQYDMLVTEPKPDITSLNKYYQSKEYISHTDSRKSFLDKIYHIIKKYTIYKKVKLITKLNNGTGTLLDIGAGTGDFLKTAKTKGWKIKGTEPNVQARILADKKNILLDSMSCIYKENNFDVITMWHVLEHVYDLNDQIKELKRLLKPNGYLVIAVPNYKSFDAKYYKSFWAAYDVPRHLWHFSKKGIEKLFLEENIQLEKTFPMIFDSFYVSLLSEKYKNGKINIFNAFRVGLISNIKANASKEYSSRIYVLKNSDNQF